MTGNSLLGYTNYVDLENTSLTATSEEPTLPVANLQVDQGSPSTAWQT